MAAVGVGAYAVTRTDDAGTEAAQPDGSTTTKPPETTTTTKPPYTGWVDPESAFQPYYKATTTGLRVRLGTFAPGLADEPGLRRVLARLVEQVHEHGVGDGGAIELVVSAAYRPSEA